MSRHSIPTFYIHFRVFFRTLKNYFLTLVKRGILLKTRKKIQVRNLISNLYSWCRWPESNRHGLFNRRILSYERECLKFSSFRTPISKVFKPMIILWDKLCKTLWQNDSPVKSHTILFLLEFLIYIRILYHIANVVNIECILFFIFHPIQTSAWMGYVVYEL